MAIIRFGFAPGVVTPSASNLTNNGFNNTTGVWSVETDTQSQGDWVWGRFANGTTGITPDGSGGFSSAPQESGTIAVGASPVDLDIPETGTTGTDYELFMYQRIGGQDSNIITIGYTADNTAPVFQAGTSTPADGATGAGTTGDLTAVWSETVQAGSGNFYLYDTSGPTLIDTVAIGACTITGTDVDIPFADRSAGTDYSVRWDAGIVEDLRGNAVTANTGDTLWNFTTAAGGAVTGLTLVEFLNNANNCFTFSGGPRPDFNTTANIAVGEELFIFVMMSQVDAAVTDADLHNFNLGAPTIETPGGSRSTVFGWRVQGHADMLDAAARLTLTGSGGEFSTGILRIDGTIATEEWAGAEFTDSGGATDPLTVNVDTQVGYTAALAVKERIDLGSGSFTWGGGVAATTAAFTDGSSSFRMELATGTSTAQTPATYTATHGNPESNDHAAIFAINFR